MENTNIYTYIIGLAAIGIVFGCGFLSGLIYTLKTWGII